MSVVCNASPLINLAQIGLLTLLRDLYHTLVIPDAVWHEVVVAGAGQPGAPEVQAANWITGWTVTNRPLVQALRQELDAGEAEAIALALELRAELLIMDERLGRETARHLGVPCIGVIGVLLEARQTGKIQALTPYLDALRHQAGFWISEPLYQRVRQDVGEG